MTRKVDGLINKSIRKMFEEFLSLKYITYLKALWRQNLI